jgi:hypothetical protein
VDVALHDRPALKEVLGVLVACAVLLAVLAKLDNQAAREYQARAVRAIAAQAAEQRAHPRTPVAAIPVAKVEARTESLGGRGPISIPVGAAWTAGTSAAVAHTHAEREDPAPPVATPALRRIVGPVPAGAVSERTTKTQALPAKPAPAPMAAAAPAEPARRPTAPLMLLIVAGLLIAASGAVLSRRSA